MRSDECEHGEYPRPRIFDPIPDCLECPRNKGNDYGDYGEHFASLIPVGMNVVGMGTRTVISGDSPAGISGRYLPVPNPRSSTRRFLKCGNDLLRHGVIASRPIYR
jgi:hypothetical protein